MRYEIKVEGVLDESWTTRFAGLTLSADERTTVLAGDLADQAALHGVLDLIRDLGLVIVSVRRDEE